MFGTWSSIVDICVIYFLRVELTVVLCFIYLHVELALVLWNSMEDFPCAERALVLCNFVSYFFVCGTFSGIVEFRVILLFV